MSESMVAHMHPIFGDILSANFRLKDATIMRDQHDPETQPSLQQQEPSALTDAPAPADSVLVDQVAAALSRAVQAAQGDWIIPFEDLAPIQRRQYRDVAHLAWMLLSREQQQAAQFVAAEQLIAERTGGNHSWRTASGQARRLAWGDAHVACTSYRQWLMGILPSEWEGRAKQALAEMKTGGAR